MSWWPPNKHLQTKLPFPNFWQQLGNSFPQPRLILALSWLQVPTLGVLRPASCPPPHLQAVISQPWSVLKCGFFLYCLRRERRDTIRMLGSFGARFEETRDRGRKSWFAHNLLQLCQVLSNTRPPMVSSFLLFITCNFLS